MKKKTRIAQISILVITLLLTKFPVRADDLAAPVPAPTDFWVRDQPGRITHTCGGKESLVLCMQGRKVVMQVQSDRTNGFSYTARFFNLQKEVEKKQALFEAGRESTPELRVNDQPWKSEFPSSVAFDGMLTLTYPEAEGVVVTRTVYPSMTKALVIEEWQVRNTTGKQVVVTVAPARKVTPVGEDVAIVWSCLGVKTAEVEAGGVLSFSTRVQAGLAAEPDLAVNVAAEHGARLALVEAAWRGPGRLETPEPRLDHAFALQKLHVLESPIETIKGVITHNGSLTYSPGIWANDPPEYSSPLFPFFGDAELNKASMQMYRIWLDHCLEHGIEHGIDPFPGSFEHAALKLTQKWRGDDAMVLYGLAKFLLFQGDRAAAEEMWPLIEFSAGSVQRNTRADGIVASKTDEMEDRYPTGDANLSTSSLAYGGYRLAANLARSLNKPVAAEFDQRADTLRKAIESFFGAEVEGFHTYRYFKENTVLRGWILLPLAMGITERQNATLDAMVSDKLWPNRMQGGDILAASDRRETEWGRETYYALRVLFKAGRTEEAIDLTRRVVKAQIFGAKGPYPDEDAIDMLCPGSLYPRVFTEGMFGIVPTGLDSFECTPWLPKDWPRMALRDLRAFGQSWDLVVERVGDQQKVTVLSGGKTLMTGLGPAGKTYALTFPVAVSGTPVSGTSPIAEPYPYISTGSFSGPAVPESPDPLVAYRWPSPKATDGLEIYLLKPSAVSSDTKESFDNLGSLTTDHPNVTVNGAGSIRMDFGRESAAWLEFDSPDCPGDVEMSISEYNEPDPGKTKAPVKHGDTYRLELNAELYEGVRFAWIHVKASARPWRITGIRAVCQVKPTNYRGRFSCSDPLLTKIWYMSAYGVKASLCKDYFGAILMDRGDRMSWTGDAHTSQAAALAAFGNFDFIRKNIDNTSQQSNGIRSYSLYWVLSLLDYYRYTGDAETLLKYIDNVSKKLDEAHAVFGTDPKLKFYGWDERLCAGFEIWFRAASPEAQESQNAYKMLSIRTWKEFAAVMGQYGRADLRDKYNGYADGKMAELRKAGDWSAVFGLHAAADAITTGSLTDKEKDTFFEKHFLDRVSRLSLSPFNQYFIIQAMARVGRHDDALSSIRDMWGGMVNYGGTTTFEVYRPSWNEVIGTNDAVPNAQCGIVSLCHPWGAGVVKWLSEEVLGIVSTTPGFKTYDILPHVGRTLTQVSGEMPTPTGNICASFDLASGRCAVSAPAGTVGRVGLPKAGKTITGITINGKPAWNGAWQAVAGIGGAREDADFVYFTGVKPGVYDIVVAYTGMTPAYDEPQVKYAVQSLKQDKTTGGDWGDVYGKDGYILCNYNGEGRDEKVLPPYVKSVEYYRAFPKSGVPDPQMWAAETADKRALAPDKHNGSGRKAAGYSNSDQTMSLTIGIDGEREYQVALYFVDWNKNGCRQAVEMMDAETLNQVAPVKIVDDFSGGAYLVYKYNKSVKFRINKVRGPIASLSGIFFDPASVEGTTMKLLNGVQQRWTEDKANAWYQQQPWLVGCNFVPSTAVNAIEMWQTETFDPVTIERELGWAKQMGFNTVRVFHNFVVWKADADGLKKRFDQFLAIASKLGIRAMPVLFCDCNFAGGVPHPGKQPEPTPLVHNSQWVSSPPPAMVGDMNAWPELERYVKDMVTSFKNDPRIVIWDLYNEPSVVGSDLLLVESFRWARACSPAQPLTFGAWEGWNKYTDAIIAQSDVISFHCYANKEGVLGRIIDLKKRGRPVICSEWMSRPAGSRFDIDLPMFKKEQVGCYQWGLVNGRTQTHLVMHDPKPPVLWQHDLLHRDGTPYSRAEIYAIKHATGIIATPPTTLVPTSEDQQITWSFTTDTPAGEWSKPGFDESAWKKGKAPFASAPFVSNDLKSTTEWKGADIWIRRVIELPAEVKGLVALRIKYDDEAEVYLNGICAARLSGCITNYALHDITPEARGTLKPGRNLLAIHCHNKAGGQFVDAGLVLLDEGKPEKSQ